MFFCKWCLETKCPSRRAVDSGIGGGVEGE